MLPLQSAAPRPYQRPSDFGQLERRGPPGVLVERRLHVVVGVEQHGRRVRVGGPAARRDGLAAVAGSPRRPRPVKPTSAKRVDHPVRGPRALLGRELPRVGDRRDRDQLGQVVAGAGHQRGDPVRRSIALSPPPRRRSSGRRRTSWKSSSVLRAVDLDDRAAGPARALLSAITGRCPGPGRAVGEHRRRASLRRSASPGSAQTRAAVVAEHAGRSLVPRRHAHARLRRAAVLSCVGLLRRPAGGLLAEWK